MKHHAVREAAVTAVAWGSGDNELVAYLVADDVATTDELRAFLRKSLPDYMIPTVFVPLDSLPLNPSGKIDYKALPAPVRQRDEHYPFVAPRTPGGRVAGVRLARDLACGSDRRARQFLHTGGTLTPGDPDRVAHQSRIQSSHPAARPVRGGYHRDARRAYRQGTPAGTQDDLPAVQPASATASCPWLTTRSRSGFRATCNRGRLRTRSVR